MRLGRLDAHEGEGRPEPSRRTAQSVPPPSKRQATRSKESEAKEAPARLPRVFEPSKPKEADAHLLNVLSPVDGLNFALGAGVVRVNSVDAPSDDEGQHGEFETVKSKQQKKYERAEKKRLEEEEEAKREAKRESRRKKREGDEAAAEALESKVSVPARTQADVEKVGESGTPALPIATTRPRTAMAGGFPSFGPFGSIGPFASQPSKEIAAIWERPSATSDPSAVSKQAEASGNSPSVSSTSRVIGGAPGLRAPQDTGTLPAFQTPSATTSAGLSPLLTLGRPLRPTGRPPPYAPPAPRLAFLRRRLNRAAVVQDGLRHPDVPASSSSAKAVGRGGGSPETTEVDDRISPHEPTQWKTQGSDDRRGKGHSEDGSKGKGKGRGKGRGKDGALSSGGHGPKGRGRGKGKRTGNGDGERAESGGARRWKPKVNHKGSKGETVG